MNVSKISPAPWYLSKTKYDYSIVSEPSPPGQNGILSLWCSGHLTGDYKWNDDNGEFIALARNAFDIMLRRRWYPVTDSRLDGNAWIVPTKDGYYGVWADPFTAMVETEKWYKENANKR